MLVFAHPLPGTPSEALRGLGGTVVVRAPHEPRGPGTTAWTDALPAGARAGDHLITAAHDPATAQARARGVRVWWRCMHPRDVKHSIEAGVAAWLLGAEAGGLTGRSTALVLIRALFAHGSARIPWVAAGLTPGARAASLAVGAAGMVLDTELWGIPDSPLHPSRRQALSRVGVRDTHLIGDEAGLGVRVWVPRAQVEALSLRIGRDGVGSFAASLDRWWLEPAGPAPAPVSLMQAAGHASAAERVSQARQAVARHLDLIGEHHPLRLGCDPLGTGVPIVQGPMANVAEGPGLARAVADSGALPFVALGALRPSEAEAVLDGVTDLPSCGAGLIAFDVAPHRDAHIQALEARGPRPVILAGGSPSLARRLAERGLDPWLHTPSPRLAGFAVSSGVDTVVLEGHEAGGHVGPIPASALWDLGLRAVTARQRSAEPARVILAGGIGDAVSAAFAAALAAPAAAEGVRVALQAGTAFFFTREIVASGQLSQVCQQVALTTEDTVLVGESVNLPLRCAPNAFTTEARQAELAWAAQGLDLRARRSRVEEKNLGRTRIAAKGIERDPAWSGQDPERRHRPVPEERARREGAFTLGQGATIQDRVRSVAELVHELTAGARALLDGQHRWGRAAAVSGAPSQARRGPEIRIPLGLIGGGTSPQPRRDASGPIAIVGMGCALPGGPDLLGWWRSQLRGVDAVRPIPADRWDAARYAHPDAGHHGPALSASIAAAVAADVPFDPLRYRIPPRVLPTVDRAQRLALLAGDEAVHEADLQALDPARSAVFLGNAMGGEWRSKMALRVRFREVIGRLDLAPDQRDRVEALMEASLDAEVVPLQGESMVGLLGNVAAGRLAAWLDWQGGSHTVDGACAASLLAVGHAVDALRTGRVDLVLTGGVDTDLAIDTYVGFTRTRALSSAGSRPFSRDADGFVMGEGAACFALTRLEDAVRLGLPVWAVIRGIGTSSDGRGRGLTAPRPQGQRLAIERAWTDAQLDPSAAAYVEAHGTGTTLGDRTEAEVLHAIFGEIWAGTAKGAVGHLKSAAGAAGLLRAVLAVSTGVLPPTQNVGPPIDQAKGLRLPRRPTRLPDGVPHAGVSAFGFGGTNAHIVVSAPPDGLRRPAALQGLLAEARDFVCPPPRARWTRGSAPSPSALTPSPVLHLFAGPDRAALAEAVRTRQHAPLPGAGPHRLAVLVDPMVHPDTRALLHRIAEALHAGAALPQPNRVCFVDERVRPIVVVAPGQGAQRPGAVASLRRFALADALLDELESALGGPVTCPDHPDTRALHRHLFAVGGAWASVLRAAGLPIEGALGHSLGELAAVVAAGCVDAVSLAPAVRARGEALHAAPAGAMLAVLADADAAESLAQSHALHVAARNSPRTTVLAGPQERVGAAAAHARRLGLRVRSLDVAHAFHTPDVDIARAPLRRALDRTSFSDGPFWSATARRGPVPASLVEALTAPVDFGPVLAERCPSEALVLELGPGRSLHPHVRAAGLRIISLDPDPQADVHGPVRAAARLWAAGRGALLERCPGVDLRVASQRRPLGAAAFRATPRSASKAMIDATLPPAPAPRPAPSTPGRPPSEPGASDVRQQVLHALHEVTGYSAEALQGAGDLQADLGIDSVQRLEVLGVLQDRLGLSLSPEAEERLERADLAELVRIITASQHDGEAQRHDTLAWVHRASWQAQRGARQPAPEDPGWSRIGEVALWSPRVLSSAEEAVLDLLRAVPDAPAAEAWAAWVPDDAVGHAVAAALRCIGAERRLPVHALHRAGRSPREMPVLDGIDASVLRHGPAGWELAAWQICRAPALDPERSPRCVVATGGLRGILVPILGALQPARVLVLGRSPADSVQDELEALQCLVPGASYAAADVTDASAVESALAELDTRPELILHGAAILRDRRADALTEDDVRQVFAPKLGGLKVLRQLLPEVPLALLSSLAAHAPSPGQTAYAAANAAAEKCADRAIALTAWEGPGLADSPAVRAALSSRGVRPLPRGLGADAVVRCLLGRPQSCLITTAPLPGTMPGFGWPLRHVQDEPSGWTARLGLSPEHPELADHRLVGRPVVPAAVWLDLALREPGRVEDFEILAPLFVDSPRQDVRVDVDEDCVQVRVNERLIATARRAACPPRPGLTAPPEPSVSAQPAYRADLLFHGPLWRTLDAVGGDGNGTITGRLRADTDSAGLLDGAHQLLALWAGRHLGWSGLPVGAGAWTRFSTEAPSHLAAWPRRSPDATDEVVADVMAWGPDGVVFHGEGVRLRRASALTPEVRALLTQLLPGSQHA